MRGGKQILLVSSEKAGLSVPFAEYPILIRPDDLTSNADHFASASTQWLETTGSEARRQQGRNEAQRLLALGENRAAVVAAVAMLERELVHSTRVRFDGATSCWSDPTVAEGDGSGAQR